MKELAPPELDPTAHGQRTRLELPDINGAVVSGKYGPGWQPAYDVRLKYQEAGIPVAFPRGNTPIESYSGYTFSEEQEQYIPFPYMQDRFFELIAENPYHTVVTGKSGPEGTVEEYAGFSTSHEIAYAILKAKPIILSSRIEQFSSHVPKSLKRIILKNQNRMTLKDPAQMSSEEIKSLIAGLDERVDYKLTNNQAREVEERREDLCDLEMHRWFSWTIKTERDYQCGQRKDWINERSARYCIPPRAYLPPEDMATDEDAQYYTDPAVYSSFMVRMYFPDFGK